MLHEVLKEATSTDFDNAAAFSPQLDAHPVAHDERLALACTRLNLTLSAAAFFGEAGVLLAVWHPMPPKPSTHTHFRVLLSQWPLMPQSTPHTVFSQPAPK